MLEPNTQTAAPLNMVPEAEPLQLDAYVGQRRPFENDIKFGSRSVKKNGLIDRMRIRLECIPVHTSYFSISGMGVMPS